MVNVSPDFLTLFMPLDDDSLGRQTLESGAILGLTQLLIDHKITPQQISERVGVETGIPALNFALIVVDGQIKNDTEYPEAEVQEKVFEMVARLPDWALPPGIWEGKGAGTVKVTDNLTDRQ